jgi:aryl-alcohol dehydrogenase-like predicted oxidoreductase
MTTRQIGSLAVSAVGLGCNQFGRKIDVDRSTRVVHAAIDAGVNFFDTADRYGYGDLPWSGFGQSEVFLGRALAGRRDQVVLATKFGMSMTEDTSGVRGDRDYVIAACEASLRRLGTDHIDLYLMHRPDRATPVEETLSALDELVAQGKVREVGWSNVSATDIRNADAAAAGRARFVAVQNEYSLLHRDVERDVLPTCVERDVAFVPYFPLASGLLTGKYRSDESPPADARLASFAPNRPHLGLSAENLRAADELAAFAVATGHSLVELAVSWLLSRPAVASVIAGATTEEQVRTNAAAGGWRLSETELAQVDQILLGERPTGA